MLLIKPAELLLFYTGADTLNLTAILVHLCGKYMMCPQGKCAHDDALPEVRPPLVSVEVSFN